MTKVGVKPYFDALDSLTSRRAIVSLHKIQEKIPSYYQMLCEKDNYSILEVIKRGEVHIATLEDINVGTSWFQGYKGGFKKLLEDKEIIKVVKGVSRRTPHRYILNEKILTNYFSELFFNHIRAKPIPEINEYLYADFIELLGVITPFGASSQGKGRHEQNIKDIMNILVSKYAWYSKQWTSGDADIYKLLKFCSDYLESIDETYKTMMKLSYKRWDKEY
jgi:hypothetical protein